ncbi:hypothetical protein CVV38_03930 [Candidatus Peregrinibacteria bacterium HGW-Peregrinibacteria-1]|jgi:hypothetical protein|nr:MAG: hypothetical protein CVV38_03930 [Candidatus Peregrinibacteria bacterium HGW-Peregrinibacteria-1]
MKKILFGIFVSLMSISLTVSAVTTSGGFSDVEEGSFYSEAVSFLAEKGIVVGYADGSFGYDLTINRAEFMKLVMETAYLDEDQEFAALANESCFGDVPAGEWFTGYICYAKEQGWVVGYSDGLFRPAANINFVEAMKIVLEVFGEEYNLASQPWYRGIVEKASDNNLIPLTIDSFGQLITRAEMADMMTRKIKSEAGQLDEYLGMYYGYVATYASIESGTTSGDFGLCGEPVCKKDYLIENFYPFVYGIADSSHILGVEGPAGNIIPVGDGFWTVSQGDGGWYGTVGSSGMLEFDNGLYFSTYGYSYEDGSTMSILYKYDANEDVAEKVYEWSGFAGEGEEVPYLRFVAGLGDGERVVLQEIPSVDWSPGGCANFDWVPDDKNFQTWLASSLNYYVVDVTTSIEDRVLEEYVVPQWRVNIAEAEMAACLESVEE